MSMEPISESIYELLLRQGIDAGKPASRLATKGTGRAATRRKARIKARSSANGDALAGVAGREMDPIRLAWSNPAANTKRARGWTHLVLIDGGRQ
jgi:hypothetical protein